MSSRLSGERTAMLFCPPFPPLRLERASSIAIGRHPSCELTLSEEDVSRRHAEVHHEDAGYVLYDMKSTNGTFLNGERVDGSRRLAPGDRIGIGPKIITFCEVEYTSDADWGEAVGAATILSDLPEESAEASQGFLGDLSEIPPSALLQLLEMGNNSGRLAVETTDGDAAIWFRSGRPVHAATEKLLGFDAALAIVQLELGQFRFHPGEEGPENTIQASVTELLLEACRLMDEEAAR